MDDNDPLSAARGVVNALLLSAIIWLLLAIGATYAWGASQVILTPPRITLEPSAQAGYFRLVNKGDQPATYNVTTTGLLQGEPGTDVCQALLMAPKRLTVDPGQSKVVRFLLRSGWTGTEERCRVRFEAVAPEVRKGASDKPAVGVTFLLSFTSPIIRGEGR